MRIMMKKQGSGSAPGPTIYTTSWDISRDVVPPGTSFNLTIGAYDGNASVDQPYVGFEASTDMFFNNIVYQQEGSNVWNGNAFNLLFRPHSVNAQGTLYLRAFYTRQYLGSRKYGDTFNIYTTENATYTHKLTTGTLTTSGSRRYHINDLRATFSTPITVSAATRETRTVNWNWTLGSGSNYTLTKRYEVRNSANIIVQSGTHPTNLPLPTGLIKSIRVYWADTNGFTKTAPDTPEGVEFSQQWLGENAIDFEGRGYPTIFIHSV